MLGGGGQWPLYALKKKIALHFHTRSLEINIFKVHFREGGRGPLK